MSGPHSPKTAEQVSAEDVDARAADFIFRKCDLEGWSVGDQAALDSWLAKSFAHRTAYWRLEAAWERADRLSALRSRSPHGGSSRGEREFGLSFKIVAAAALIAALGAAIWTLSPGERESVYATAIGDHELITLADGSHIDLNTNSELQIQRDTDQRVVRLVRGEAFFEIQHNPAHPFVVLAAAHRVTDIGTKFLVREQQGRVKVAVVEGSARLESDVVGTTQSGTVLLPGDVALATASSVTMTRKPVDTLRTELSWRHGVLAFHHAALAEVAAEYNRYNQQQIVIGDASLSQLTISAQLPTNDVNAFARMAKNFLGLRVQNKGDEIVISR